MHLDRFKHFSQKVVGVALISMYFGEAVRFRLCMGFEVEYNLNALQITSFPYCRSELIF